MKFSDVPADPAIKERLIQTIAGQRVSHAQLFFGPEGSGKLALAIAYAQLSNCIPRSGNKSPLGDLGVLDSCGVCPSCVQFQKLAHPDLHFFFPTATSKTVSSKPSSKLYIPEWREYLLKNDFQVTLNSWYDFIGIENKQGTIYADDAAEINRILGYKSYESEYKVLIIWMIEKLYATAAPKLLKILEEPPEKTLFILISDNPDHIIPTILSRCLPVRIPKIPVLEVRDYLIRKTGCTAGEAETAARSSGGNIRDALRRIGQTTNDRVPFETFRNWMRLCFAHNIPELVGFASEAGKMGREKQKSLLHYALGVTSQSTGFHFHAGGLVAASAEEEDFIRKFLPFVTPEKLPRFYELFDTAIGHIERNAHAPTLFLDLSLKLHTLIKG